MIVKELCIKRPSNLYAIYKMEKHKPSERNPDRKYLLFSSVERMKHDGLNNFESLNVTIVKIKKQALSPVFKTTLLCLLA